MKLRGLWIGLVIGLALWYVAWRILAALAATCGIVGVVPQ